LHSDARANFAAAQKRIANPPKDWKSAECPLISTEFQCFNQHRTVPNIPAALLMNGRSMPCAVTSDRRGKVLSKTFRNATYVELSD